MSPATGLDDVSDSSSSPVGQDLAVQPVDTERNIPVDGPVIEVKPSSHDLGTSTLEDELLTEIESAALQSPFQSPRSSENDVMSDTSLEDGEVPESWVENSPVIENEDQEDNTHISKHKVEETDRKPKPEYDIIEAAPSVDQTVTETPGIDAAAITCPTLACTGDATVLVDVPAVESTYTNKFPKATQETAASSVFTNDVDDDGQTTAKIAGRSEPIRSVPPHLRTDSPSTVPRPSGLQDSKYSTAATGVPRYPDVLRVPRNHYAHGAPRNFDGREEVARLTAQLMKVRDELDAERKKSAGMCKSIEQETQKTMDAALASMTTDLLNKQFKTLAHQAKVEAMERDLLFRRARIEQLEVFLSEGQKQVYRQSNSEDSEEEAGLSMTEVNREHDRRQAELKAQKDIADREGKLDIRYQGLKLLEAGQEKRERQYKALIRKSIEAEVREKEMPDMDVKLNEVAEIEYNRGFGAGKMASHVEGEKEAREKGFLEGYDACHRAEVALSKMRKGLIARDSPELDFLFDAGHPNNVFTMGAKIGGMSFSQDKNSIVSSVAPKWVQAERQPVPEQRRAEEPARKNPPPRPTFAAELRGASNMHNGQHVLANGSAPSPPKPTSPANDTNGIYEGRRIMKYEEVAEDSLIDL